MYDVILSVIKSKNYELTDMLAKINTLWIHGVKNGGISDEEKEELIALARQNAEIQQSIDIISKLEELDKRVKALEESKIEDSNNSGENATYPPYEAGKWYYNGNIIEFEGKNYRCIAPEKVVCTWSPSEYPLYWEAYAEDSPLTE